jgi:hypothetical protein
MQRAYFYFSACNSLSYLDLKVYKSYKFNFCVYSFVAQRVTVNRRYFPGLADFLLTLRFQSLRRLGNFFYLSTSAYFACLSAKRAILRDSAYPSLDRFYQTAYAVTILSLSNHPQQENNTDHASRSRPQRESR